MTAYGVFDFGGGTTDFDFGIEKLSANPRRCKFELHQFGRGGDPYLGGENILNHLAFEVYCANLDTMRKESIPIALPHGCTAPAGTETLILADREATQISFMNRKSLAEALRPLWEGKSESAENLKDNQLNLSLFVDTSRTEKEANQNRKTVDLTIDTGHLKDVIRSLISRGVTNFFQAWQEAFKNREEMPDHIHIFLLAIPAGRLSSRNSLTNKSKRQKRIFRPTPMGNRLRACSSSTCLGHGRKRSGPG